MPQLSVEEGRYLHPPLRDNVSPTEGPSLARPQAAPRILGMVFSGILHSSTLAFGCKASECELLRAQF